MVPPRCAPSEEITKMSGIFYFSQRTYCTGGVALREASLCVPAHHFTEHMKVLQSFKKGGTHTLLHYKLWRSSGTLHTASLNMCAECKTGARMEDAATLTASLIQAFFFCGK
ncbi:uncharacterized protein LOC123507688 [Portunus trituberculatus]|uniref:uncharacterized protein LOC123507688 n=1 Tax=Portunus trituberculatus TaxID=210409 RepID=UPI001E1CBF29|nr:uncharacterized protein LOC123507688 [Portunus trituberculatus]XP_045116765.1 uncharacterized protein LOC123507688 [Portunus trituberculatus]